MLYNHPQTDFNFFLIYFIFLKNHQFRDEFRDPDQLGISLIKIEQLLSF